MKINENLTELPEHGHYSVCLEMMRISVPENNIMPEIDMPVIYDNYSE